MILSDDSQYLRAVQNIMGHQAVTPPLPKQQVMQNLAKGFSPYNISIPNVPGFRDMSRGGSGGSSSGGGGAYNSAPAGKGVQRWASLVGQVLQELGQPQSLVQTTLRRMQQESGGNPRAINNWDSNARRGTPSMGLMQTIQPTFNAYAGKYRSAGAYDPRASLYSSMRYAISRYGSLANAYNRKGGY